MNLANKITLLRICLIPVFIFFMLVDGPYFMLIATGIFLLASLTDSLDGHIARKNNMVTTFGKFVDPLADKLLVAAAMVCLVEAGKVSSVVTIIILSREFIVTGFRTLAASEGKVIAASIWGKLKTVTQLIAITAMLLSDYLFGFAPYIPTILIYLSTIITLYSGFDYIYKNRKLINKM